MPTNYNIAQPNDTAGQCSYCGGSGCQYCRKMTCPQCDGIITAPSNGMDDGRDHGCPFCLGTAHGFTSDLIQQTHISLPNTTVRPFAGERGASVNPPQIVMSRRR
jgi:hypothetical protein